ncbi:hypothetical protein FDUTEX481_03446 [Tolypothrix sp. PCC 7601]|nr:hypothetical protein FDUTEX481_03446 [Tolypothrix sp. PCC 7601]
MRHEHFLIWYHLLKKPEELGENPPNPLQNYCSVFLLSNTNLKKECNRL